MALSDIDRGLLERCLTRQPKAWEDFVDRFLGLVVHVIRHTAQSRSLRLSQADYDDLAAEVFLAIVKDDYAVLRRFRRASSLATYLTVIARRVVVRELLKRKEPQQLTGGGAPSPGNGTAANGHGAAGRASGDSTEDRLLDREEIEQLLSRLEEPEARLVRMHHLEGKSYQQISAELGMPENSVGPALSRARAKMRKAADNQAAV